MNSDFSQLSPEERDARITSLLLGELLPPEADELRAIIAADPELARACERRERTIGLLREAACRQLPAGEPSEVAAVEPPRLSDDRREKLLKTFQSAAPVPRASWRLRLPRVPRWSMPMAAAAILVGLLILSVTELGDLLPWQKPKARAQRIALWKSSDSRPYVTGSYFSDNSSSIRGGEGDFEQQVKRHESGSKVSFAKTGPSSLAATARKSVERFAIALPNGERELEESGVRQVPQENQVAFRFRFGNEAATAPPSDAGKHVSDSYGIVLSADGTANQPQVTTINGRESKQSAGELAYQVTDLDAISAGAMVLSERMSALPAPVATPSPAVAKDKAASVVDTTDLFSDTALANPSVRLLADAQGLSGNTWDALKPKASTPAPASGKEMDVTKSINAGASDSTLAKTENSGTIVLGGQFQGQAVGNFTVNAAHDFVSASPAGLPATAPVLPSVDRAPLQSPVPVPEWRSKSSTGAGLGIAGGFAPTSGAEPALGLLTANAAPSMSKPGGSGPDVAAASGRRGDPILEGAKWFENSQSQNSSDQLVTGGDSTQVGQSENRGLGYKWAGVKDSGIGDGKSAVQDGRAPWGTFQGGKEGGNIARNEAEKTPHPAIPIDNGVVSYFNGAEVAARPAMNQEKPVLAFDNDFDAPARIDGTKGVQAGDDLSMRGAQDREWAFGDSRTSFGRSLNSSVNPAITGIESLGAGSGGGGLVSSGGGLSGGFGGGGRGRTVVRRADNSTLYAGIQPALPTEEYRDLNRDGTVQFRSHGEGVAGNFKGQGIDQLSRKEVKESSTPVASTPTPAIPPSRPSLDAAGLPIEAELGDLASTVTVRRSEPQSENKPLAPATKADSSDEITKLSEELSALQTLRDRTKQIFDVTQMEANQTQLGAVQVIEPAEAGSSDKPSLWGRISGAFSGGGVQKSAVLSVEPDMPDVDPQARIMFRPSADPFFIQTEFERIRSTNVLRKVAEKLNLQEEWAKRDGKDKLSEEETIALLRKRVDVSQQANTTLLEIRAKSENPEEAAQIANAVAEVYSKVRGEARGQVTRGGLESLEKQLAAKDLQIAQAKERLEQKRKELGSEPSNTNGPKPSAAAPVPQPEVLARENAFSTFSLNVSDVSFKLAAASLEKGAMPEAANIRSEEFINAFDYRDPMPALGAPLAFAWERARYPFAHNRDVVRFSIKTAAQGREAGKPLNIVVLLDNSGSMERADRVRIIQESLRTLAAQLKPQDKISVVTFARTASLRVDGVSGTNAVNVANQIGALTPEGGTNLEDALDLAYRTALRHYEASAVNRIVLLTDGAANLGNVEPKTLKAKVENYRKQGIALDCFGIGWEGFNDDLLEQLSRNGDGRYGFVNTPEEAASEFVGQLAGALRVAASDVKMQVEFNPKRVTAYRQIGYAKHQLTKEQFRDNKVDAAEIGAAESGNALYVIETNPNGEGPIATVRARFRVPQTSDYREHEWVVPFGSAVELQQSSPALRLAASASAFSEWLAASPFAGEVATDRLLQILSGVPETYGADPRPKKLEWMIRQAKSISGK